MTLLVLLFVISSYAVIPWWAWTLGWLKLSFYVVFAVQQAREKLKQQRLLKQNEEFIAELTSQYKEAAQAQIQGRRVEMGSGDTMN